MKKIFTIETKDDVLLGDLEYNVYAKNIKEAITKVEKVLEKKRYIFKAEFLCNVDEDEDLKSYLKELKEEEKANP